MKLIQCNIVWGSLLSGHKNYTLVLENDSSILYAEFLPNELNFPLLEKKIKLTPNHIQTIINAIDACNFFQLKPEYITPNIENGYFINIHVKTQKKWHSVEFKNQHQHVVPIIQAFNKVLSPLTQIKL
jgi:hypothetical protein